MDLQQITSSSWQFRCQYERKSARAVRTSYWYRSCTGGVIQQCSQAMAGFVSATDDRAKCCGGSGEDETQMGPAWFLWRRDKEQLGLAGVDSTTPLELELDRD